jgi:hypothetical protein
VRVFGTDLDGCLAHTGEAIESRFYDEFGEIAVCKEGSWAVKYPTIPYANLKGFLRDIFANPSFLLDAVADDENIAEMNKWVLAGMVPSIITRRDPATRAVTELWLARNNVPYSNFLLGVTDKGRACWHVDASFMIEDGMTEARTVADMGIKCYVVRTPYNEGYEPLNLDNIVFVNNYAEVSELEKIK